DVCCWKAAFDTEDTEAQRTQRNFRLSKFALRYRRACSGRTRNIEVSLCPLCLCALCVQRELPGLVLRDIDVCCWKAAFDTGDTEAQRTQRNFRLSKPFLRYLRTCRTSGRTGVDGMRVSATGSKPTFTAQGFIRRGSRQARWSN